MRISYGNINSNLVCGSSTATVRWNDGVPRLDPAACSSHQKLMGADLRGASLFGMTGSTATAVRPRLLVRQLRRLPQQRHPR